MSFILFIVACCPIFSTWPHFPALPLLRSTCVSTASDLKEMSGSLKPSKYDELYPIYRRMLSYIFDVAAFSCSAFIAFNLRFDGSLPAQLLHPMLIAMCVWVVFQKAAFIACRVSWDHWRYTSTYDAVIVQVASLVGSIAGGLMIVLLLGPWGIPQSVYVLDWLLVSLLTQIGRASCRERV